MLSSLEAGDAKAYECVETISNHLTGNSHSGSVSDSKQTEIDITTSAKGRGTRGAEIDHAAGIEEQALLRVRDDPQGQKKYQLEISFSQKFLEEEGVSGLFSLPMLQTPNKNE